MPVILREENYDLWLDAGFKDAKALGEVLVPFDAAQMRCFPVSTRINAVTNDDPDCLVPNHNHYQLRVLFSDKVAGRRCPFDLPSIRCRP
jgi:hypothetical protein